MPRFPLPDAPADLAGPVKAWSEPVAIPTYLPDAPDPNPRFLENRVYQGSSGCVYPLPFIDRIATEPCGRAWQAVHLENEFVRFMVLPEIGGRIHIGFDKTNGYDFFYRQNVIKPALVGLAGPWISGGVEFNWPQHHRPAHLHAGRLVRSKSTPTARAPSGSATTTRMNRLKGMHGLCLHPGNVVSRTEGAALQPHALRPDLPVVGQRRRARRTTEYQSFFPPDVHYVADHARRAISTYPLCEGTYYGIDYGARKPRRQRPELVQEHPRADELHGRRIEVRFLRRLRPRRRGRRHPRRRPSHLTRQEAVDLGQPRLRLRLGPQPHRRRRPLHRADGRRLHR